MTNAFTLDDIRAAAEAKYGSVPIDIDSDTRVELVNALRLPKAKRDALTGIQARLEDEDADQEALLEEALSLVAKTEAQAQALLDALNGDLAMLVSVFEIYSKGTQAGEA